MVHFQFDIRNEYFIRQVHAFHFNFNLKFGNFLRVRTIFHLSNCYKKSIRYYNRFYNCECLHFRLRDNFQIKFDVKKYT